LSYALALLSALLYGVGDFLGGHATRRGRALTVTFASQAVGLIGLGVLVPVLSHEPPPRADLAWGAAAGIAGAVGVLLLYRGLATGLASVVAPITGVCAIGVPVVVGAVLGERPGATAVAGIALAMVAVTLLGQGGSSASPSSDRARAVRRGVPLALLAGLAIGAFLVCLGRTRPVSGMWPLLAARAVSVSSVALAIAVRREPWLPPRPALPATLGSGLLDLLANAAYVLAVRQGSLGLTASLASLYPAATVALATLVWRERLRPLQIAGIVLALLAMVLITWRTG
jgi:drug/metabolite transporter (DMT)-like permease